MYIKDFDYFFNSLQNIKINTFNYFTDWNKIFNNIEKIKTELDILNCVLEKDTELEKIIKEFPSIIKIIPILIASREPEFNIINDLKPNFIHENYLFDLDNLDNNKILNIVTFIKKSGLINLFTSNKIKNFIDYMIGIEVGLDSNSRKNRNGNMMEDIIDSYINNICKENKFDYIKQCTFENIKNKFEIEINILKKLNRKIDFCILCRNNIYFIEVNFYNSQGSKLKSVSEEYKNLHDNLKKNNFKFIWITDGVGWKSSKNVIKDTFEYIDYLLNINMVNNGFLIDILSN